MRKIILEKKYLCLLCLYFSMDLLSQRTTEKCILKGIIQELREKAQLLKQHKEEVRADINNVSSLQEVVEIIKAIVHDEEGEKIFYCDT